MWKAEYGTLFQKSNYKFSTKDPGRLSSFYFEDRHGNQGRWRREHPRGELLVYQGQTIRFFTESPEDFNPDMVELVWRTAKIGHFDHEHYSRVPKNGWHVVEIARQPDTIGHCSGGTVVLADSDLASGSLPTDTYGGDISDWREMG